MRECSQIFPSFLPVIPPDLLLRAEFARSRSPRGGCTQVRMQSAKLILKLLVSCLRWGLLSSQNYIWHWDTLKHTHIHTNTIWISSHILKKPVKSSFPGFFVTNESYLQNSRAVSSTAFASSLWIPSFNKAGAHLNKLLESDLGIKLATLGEHSCMAVCLHLFLCFSVCVRVCMCAVSRLMWLAITSGVNNIVSAPTRKRWNVAAALYYTGDHQLH